MRIWTTLAVGSALLAGLTGQADASELKKTAVSQDGRRVTLELRFDAAVQYHTVYNYVKNVLTVQVDGLKLTRQQLHNGPAVHGAELKALIKSGSFVQADKTGDLQLQLAKDITPADALMIQRDNGFDIQFVLPEGQGPVSTTKPRGPVKPALKPVAKPIKPAAAPIKPADPAAAHQTSGDASDNPNFTPGPGPGADNNDQSADGNEMTSLTGQTFADPPVTIAPGSDEPAGDDPAAPDPAPVFHDMAAGADPDSASTDPNFVPDQPGSDTPSADVAASDDPAHDLALAAHSTPKGKPAGSTKPGAAAKPAATTKPGNAGKPAAGSTPSYKRFDLSQIDVNQLEIKGLPFREALSKLVSGSGFNVVVGSGIDNEPVYLNFTQKKLSLKAALETLCMAYELSYTVQDDAIVITKK